MSTVLECPKCGISRDSDDVIVTWEHNTQPGVAYSTKKTVRATIQTTYSAMDDEETLIHTCGICEYEWSEQVLDSVEVNENPGKDPYADARTGNFIDWSELPKYRPHVFPTFADRDDVGAGEAHFEFLRHEQN